MALHKFEQDIKRKLEKRTIEPSANSWNKLEAKFVSNKQKRSNSIFWMLGIAASIVGILVLTPIFFNNNEHTTPIIVDVESNNKKEIKTSDTEKETIIAEEKFNKTEATEVNNKPLIKNLKLQLSKQTKRPIEVAENNYISPTILKSKNKIIDIVVNQEILKEDPLISEEQKIKEVIYQIESLKKQQYTITEADIDALLFQAQKELALQAIYNETIKTVDAYKLLQDVEDDINKSFRIKVLETLKLNFEQMKTVIVQRND